MLYDPLEHERRSQQVADRLRTFLIGANTGGIAVVLLLADKLMARVPPQWAGWPLVIFFGGLLATGTSMMFAKAREISRRKEAVAQNLKIGEWRVEEPDVHWLRSSSTWDGIAFAAFCFGTAWALYLLSKAL